MLTSAASVLRHARSVSHPTATSAPRQASILLPLPLPICPRTLRRHMCKSAAECSNMQPATHLQPRFEFAATHLHRSPKANSISCECVDNSKSTANAHSALTIVLVPIAIAVAPTAIAAAHAACR